jgi:hypothetical protein
MSDVDSKRLRTEAPSEFGGRKLHVEQFDEWQGGF